MNRASNGLLALAAAAAFAACPGTGGGTNGNGNGNNGSAANGGSSGGSASSGKTSGVNSSSGKTSSSSSGGISGQTGGSSAGGVSSSGNGGHASGGSTGSASGSAGSASGGACKPLSTSCSSASGSLGEFSSCALSPTSCSCPLQCIPDSLLGDDLCEQASSSTQSCSDPQTILGNCGNCTLDLCTGKSVGQACNSQGTSDGTCTPLQLAGTTRMVCRQAGSAATGCDPAATRQQPSNLCTVGGFCFDHSGVQAACASDAGPAGTCSVLCNPTGGTGTCPGGSTCYPSGATDLGYCLTCNPGGGLEFNTCTQSSDCQCKYDCAAAPGGGQQCLIPCSSGYAACSTSETCQNGYCELNTCTSAYKQCVAGSGGAGECNPIPAGTSGLCTPAGTAVVGATCVASPIWCATPLSQICQPGDSCVLANNPDGGAPLSTCYQGCDPTSTLGAPACLTGTCLSASPANPYVGLCH